MGLSFGWAILLTLAAHVIVGFGVGMRLRFAALLPVFVLVLIESLIADFRFHFVPWYFLLIAGVVAVQIGYVLGFVSPLHRTERRFPHFPSYHAPAPK